MSVSWTVRQSLDAFLSENGYDAADYDAARSPAKLFGIRFSVPNPPQHRWAIMRHDLHHIATGYGTNLPGEAEVSAWEFRRGIGPLGWYVGSIVVSACLMGLVVAPRRMLRAWWASGRHPNLFHDTEHTYEELLDFTLGTLREMIGLPVDGLAQHQRGVNELSPQR